MALYVLNRSRLGRLLLDAQKEWTVYVPIKKDIVRFEPMESPAAIDLSENAYFPIKEHFFRKREVLFQFDGQKIIPTVKTAPRRLFFGVRRCDLTAIRHQDMIFIEQHQDPGYTAEREAALLIGYHCNTAPSPFCFCESMEQTDAYDLMFFDRGKEFLVDVKTLKGSAFLAAHQGYFTPTSRVLTEKDTHIKTKKLNKKDISQLYDHPDWQKGVKKCVSCAACTELCPTCYCHEIHDTVSLKKPTTGERCRSWSSCQLKEFTQIAQGHVFRDKREERFKHRIFHQLQYFKKENGVTLCTGCGRCIAGCPTRIDWVDMLNEMKE